MVGAGGWGECVFECVFNLSLKKQQR
eukprot:COSAG06_NODE_24235_length_668_cov_1.434095_2_plen_25_part_01